jgi:23S rRNA U2552 (ribose-2'-O)-methylase RlmE/FtsJ|uniref:RrmJ-type SAM-dependent 2'-O-MTase domain-containing protein n=1 Tax=viral metagenome TaxID=1070528 RepID=A0A6C0J645_9ZZZZ
MNRTTKLFIRDEDKKYLDIIVSSNRPKILNKKDYNNLQELKNKIDSKDWDKNKKFSNDYELIHIPNKRKKSDSIALYEPLSRSYFKMVEIIFDFKLFDKCLNPSFKSGHIAEGPGGFMEATYNLSHNIDRFNSYKHYGITLFSNNKDVPGWTKAANFINSDKDIVISYGVDNTGNIYNSKNIEYFSKLCGFNSCDLVTADGGFDFSLDFNKQEQLSYRLIFCEIICALSIQKKGGNFVCKIFDTFMTSTVKLLFFLGCFYDEVYLNKPLTSRPANSEKYIVAKGFKGIDYNYLLVLFELVDVWNKKPNPNEIYDILCIDMPDYFLKSINEYNKLNSKQQIDTINNTIKIIEDKNKLSFLNTIVEKQIVEAKKWCNKYKEKINIKSNFILEYREHKFK